MNDKLRLSTFLSILVALGIAYHNRIISGMNPFLGNFFYAILLVFLLWNLILVLRTSNKKVKLIQLSILMLAISIALLILKLYADSLVDDIPRRVYRMNTDVNN